MTDARFTSLDEELTIVFPGTWVMVPLHDEEAARRRIQRLVTDRVGRADRLARVRRTAKTELERLVALADDSTAFALALSLEILPGVPFPASLVLSREEWPTTPGPDDDLAVDDVDAMADRAVELGATLADPQPGETWTVLLDPAGHPFCLTDAKNWG